MALERVYLIVCPACGHKIWLLETMLEKIAHGPLLSNVGAPFLTLVCSNCTKGFRYNYEERELAAVMPIRDPLPNHPYPIAFFFRAECVDSGCESQVQLTAIRTAGTTKQDVLEELSRWDLSEIRCEKGYHLYFPDPEKTY